MLLSVSLQAVLYFTPLPTRFVWPLPKVALTRLFYLSKILVCHDYALPDFLCRAACTLKAMICLRYLLLPFILSSALKYRLNLKYCTDKNFAMFTF